MASTKRLTHGEILQWAQEIIDALGTGVRLDEHAQRFSGESAGARRDIMDGICQRLEKHRSIQPSSDRILKFLQTDLLPGPKQKPEFFDSYLRSLFACAAALGGEQKDGVCKRIFISLLQHSDPEESMPPLQPGLLQRNPLLISALNGSLSDETCLALLADSFDRWCSLIPEIVAEGEANNALTKESLFSLLKLIGARTGRLDNALRLSLPILVSAAKGAPDEFKASAHARTEYLIRESFLRTTPSPGSPERQHAAVQPTANANLLPVEAMRNFNFDEVSSCAADIRKGLLKLDDAIAERLKRQAAEIDRLRKELKDDKAELEGKDKQVSELSMRIKRVQDQLGQTDKDMADKQSEIEKLKEELDGYMQSHDALQVNLEKSGDEHAVRMKREFAERSGSVLSDIRNYLEQYLRTQDPDSVRKAVGNFNRLARILRKEGFTAADALPNIDTNLGSGEGN